jgi:hypothetical protein
MVHSTGRNGYGKKFFVLWAGSVLWLFLPSLGRAQNTGRIECARNDSYVYLYSSMKTLDVRATLRCGELVSITLRYEYYFGVRTAKGADGFVPVASIVVLKDRPGTGLPDPASEPAARERTHYDDRPHEATPARSAVPAFTLLKNTTVRVKLVKTISSATAHVGDPVELEVVDDILVEGVRVLTKGAKATGTIAEAEPKKKFGHGGKLAVSITSLLLADGEQAPLRSYEEASGSTSGSHVTAGKDAVMAENTEFAVLVDSDVRLTRELFEAPKDAQTPAPSAGVSQPQ